MNMKRYAVLIVSISLVLSISCNRDNGSENPEGGVEYQGTFYEEMDPVRYDSNGDGVIDENDNSISILGTNLNITQNPDGTPFYSGSSQSDTSGSGSGASSSSLVPVGEKLCYMDLEKYCNRNGGLYAFETSVNAAQSSVVSNKAGEDADNNGVADYVEDIRQASNISSISNTYSEKYKDATEQKIEKAAQKQISAEFIKTCLAEAITQALEEALYESNETIDVTNVETITKTRVFNAIVEGIEESGLTSSMSVWDINSIAVDVAEKIGEDVTDAISTSVSRAILSLYEKQVASGTVQYVQGICPNGYHIPSDLDWMLFESALGMSAADLTKSGETEIARGESVGIVKKMVSDFGFDYGGYASINGTYAQLGEVGVYWSSTTGTDEKGDYVWVRQIDTSYTGVVRFKMYEKSGLSIRCFKD